MWADIAPIFDKHIADQDLHSAHTLWCNVAEQFIHKLQGTDDRLRAKPRLQRGQLLPFYTEDQCPPIDTDTFSAKSSVKLLFQKTINRCKEVRARLRRWFQKTQRPADSQDGSTDQYDAELVNHACNAFWQHEDRSTDDSYDIYGAVRRIAEGLDITTTHAPNTTDLDAYIADFTARGKEQTTRIDKTRTPTKAHINHHFGYVKYDYRTFTSVFVDPSDNTLTTDVNQSHALLERTWIPIYTMHKDRPPSWDEFYHHYHPHITRQPNAPVGPPSPQQLFDQAKRARPTSAPGMDGWKPAELKHLPLVAWQHRHRVLTLSYKVSSSPYSYYHISSPALNKFDKLDRPDPTGNPNNATSPSQLRLLAIFSALYRVESGANFRAHLPWLLTWLHPALHGCVPGHDTGDVSWDAQIHVEEVLANGSDITILLMDFLKFFDLFDYDFVREMFIAVGIDTAYANLVYDLYTNLHRHIKINGTYGNTINGTNGLGQGDSAALLAALILISTQFYYLDEKYPSIAKGSCVDDRNIRGPVHQVIQAYHDITLFDMRAGHFNNPKKLVALATNPKHREILKTTNFGTHDQPVYPKVVHDTKLVGDVLTTSTKTLRAEANRRVAYAMEAARRNDSYTAAIHNKNIVNNASVIPRLFKGTRWNLPSITNINRLRTSIIKGQWQHGRTMRCKEVVLAILNNPTKMDPWGAIIMNILITTRRTLLRAQHRAEQFSRLCNLVRQERANDERITSHGPVHIFLTFLKPSNSTLSSTVVALSRSSTNLTGKQTSSTSN